MSCKCCRCQGQTRACEFMFGSLARDLRTHFNPDPHLVRIEKKVDALTESLVELLDDLAKHEARVESEKE